jgi:hypothetical protein
MFHTYTNRRTGAVRISKCEAGTAMPSSVLSADHSTRSTRIDSKCNINMGIVAIVNCRGWRSPSSHGSVCIELRQLADGIQSHLMEMIRECVDSVTGQLNVAPFAAPAGYKACQTHSQPCGPRKTDLRTFTGLY